MLNKKGKVWKASHSGGHVIYIPSDIIKDSAYPFEVLDVVNIQLDKERNCLIVTKSEEKKEEEHE